MANILLIDDEDLALFTIEQILAEANHVVVTAKDGVVGLTLFDKQPFDLVITDMVMPNQEGMQTICEIRKRSTGIPIIAMSGGARVRNVDALDVAKQNGANVVLHKPFSADDLMDAVAACIGAAGP